MTKAKKPLSVPKCGYWKSVWRPMSQGEWAEPGDQIFIYALAMPLGWAPVIMRMQVEDGLHFRTKRPQTL